MTVILATLVQAIAASIVALSLAISFAAQPLSTINLAVLLKGQWGSISLVVLMDEVSTLFLQTQKRKLNCLQLFPMVYSKI